MGRGSQGALGACKGRARCVKHRCYYLYYHHYHLSDDFSWRCRLEQQRVVVHV